MYKLKFPEIIFGTSGLGNLYEAWPQSVKMEVIGECVLHAPGPLVFDSAGKYGAGMALETLGAGLKAAGVAPRDVVISNKLGWLRTPLQTPEPTFEPGVWKNLQHDAVQSISYDGILACYEQGDKLLGDYRANWVSIHDPDEYLAAAPTLQEKTERFRDILGACAALQELKREGKVTAVGIGAKDWTVIREICRHTTPDWVMIANSMTMHSHPGSLVEFLLQLQEMGVAIINAAVFNGGFLTGLDYYNYQPVAAITHPQLFRWRKWLYAVCDKFDVSPAAACIAFAKRAPGVQSIALNISRRHSAKHHAATAQTQIPLAFWQQLVAQGLIDAGFAETYLYE
ncbi:aldo/keto reductase [Chitinophaga pollutisoli]|uniref:Aldo/keto reductase n=1 Tax=Chitinophaga pollutisoli TaxID=3133966 RepID=A0ABZ2YJC7_9BACT